MVPTLIRWLGLAGATLLALPFGIAVSLDPNSIGLGTHRQLGLPPCSFILLWQIRCPMCGMTTSWAYLMRGELFLALRANPGGVALAGLNVYLIITFLRMAKLQRRPSERALKGITAAVSFATLLILVVWLIRFRNL